MAKKENGGEIVTHRGDLAPVDEGAFMEMIGPATKAAVRKAFEGQIVEQLVPIKEPGTLIEGIYLGPGQEIEVADPQTGELRKLGTHRIRSPGNPLLVALLIDSHQLGRFLRSIPQGSRVTLLYVGQGATGRGGRRVNQWHFGHTPPNGAGEVIDVAGE